MEGCIEARLLGVARRDLGEVFAEALKMSGAKKAMIVCGEEDLDEISCAGLTHCWDLVETRNGETKIESLIVSPQDFGLPSHALADVSPGKEPHENATILTRLLRNELLKDDPILHFVLMNTAALFVVSGICEEESSDMGDGDDGMVVKERGPGNRRWKEGVRRARWAVESGEAWKQWTQFVDATHNEI